MTATQRHWAITVVRRIMPLDAAEVPRGKPVETPAVLRDLPMAPPGRARAR
jgi:hypothetical protein